MQNKVDIELQSTGPMDQVVFDFPGYGSVRIHPAHAHFWEQLQRLPANVRMRMLNISEVDANTYVTAERARLTDIIKKCFAHKGWKMRDDGSAVDFSCQPLFYDLFEIDTTKTIFLRLLKREAYSIEQMRKVVEVFSGACELYSKTLIIEKP